MSRKTRKKRTIRNVLIGAVFVAIIGALIGLGVYEVGKIFGEKPVETPSVTPTPTATPIPWDSAKKPEIEHLITKGDVLSIRYESVPGAEGYEISYRTEEGEWETVQEVNTSAHVVVETGMDYHVRVRSVGPAGAFGPYSAEGVFSTEAVNPVITVTGKNSLSASLTWPRTREGASYIVYYKATDETDWNEFPVAKNAVTVGGLTKTCGYEFKVSAVKEDYATLSSEAVKVEPDGMDYGDPFLNVYAMLRVGEESKSVAYTAKDGCLGVNCWAQFGTVLYSDVALGNTVCDLPGGTPMQITADEEGHYVCERISNRFSVHVTATVNGETKQGWTLANALFVDLAMIYPMSNQYSIQYNRTNAYSSIFTCGGNGMEVELKGEKDSRLTPLWSKDGPTSLKATGLNEIADVTGKVLPNYGPKEQMPAVWDVALQLLIAQRDALANGRCLLIYEAYRPNATSKKVYAAMTGNKYFQEEAVNGKNKLTLANGFLNKNYTEAYFIANNSAHNRGIALDLTIMKYNSVDELGEEIKMQTKMHTLDYRCDMTYNGEEANLLYDIMTKNTGLVPLVAKQEWWHFELSKDANKFPCVKDYVYANYQI